MDIVRLLQMLFVGMVSLFWYRISLSLSYYTMFDTIQLVALEDAG